jgi:Ca2+-binding RTX toxin-like protein
MVCLAVGGAGNDILHGDGGADEMSGGGGDDVFYADNAGDVVTEETGGGNDRVAAQGNFALSAGQEIELLTIAKRNIDLKGNELTQTIVGNNGNSLRSRPAWR